MLRPPEPGTTMRVYYETYLYLSRQKMRGQSIADVVRNYINSSIAKDKQIAGLEAQITEQNARIEELEYVNSEHKKRLAEYREQVMHNS